MIHFEKIGGGGLMLSPRPNANKLHMLSFHNHVLVVNLLSEKEGAHEIESQCDYERLDYIHAPIYRIFKDEHDYERLGRQAWGISCLIQNGANVFLHCAGGLHRTGAMALAILMLLGLSGGEAIDFIRQVRRVTWDEILSKPDLLKIAKNIVAHAPGHKRDE